MIIRCVIFLIWASVIIATPAIEKGTRIAQEAEGQRDGFGTEISQFKLIIKNPKGASLIRYLTFVLKEFDSAKKSIIGFSRPHDIKGTKLLTWSHDQTHNEHWLYLPVLGRVKRISGNNERSSFVGSEFSYEDLAGKVVQKYIYTYLRDDHIRLRPVWVLQRIPRDSHSGYSKEIVYLDKEYNQPLQIDYFGPDQRLLKVSVLDGYVKYDGWWRPQTVTMSNIMNGRISVLQRESCQFKTSVPHYLFIPSRLEKVSL